METLFAGSNWRLTIRRRSDGITILHAETCDEAASLPEELFGLPVTELAPRALAAGRTGGPGEEVLLRCPPHTAFIYPAFSINYTKRLSKFPISASVSSRICPLGRSPKVKNPSSRRSRYSTGIPRAAIIRRTW